MSANKVPIFAINLDASRDRWASLEERCSALDLQLHRVPAFDGRAVQPEHWTGFDPEKFRQHTGRVALPGEYGCYRSHLLALQAFVDHGAPFGLIIEDDVLPNSETAAKVDAIIGEMPGFDAVRLISHRSRYFIHFLTTSLKTRVGRTVFGPQGSAAAYLMSREGARKILAALPVMFLPWDVALERFWESGTEIFSTAENVLDFSPHRAASTIISQNGYAGTKLPLSRRLAGIGFQLREGFRRAHAVLPVPNAGEKPLADAKARANGSRPGPNPIVETAATAALLIFLSAVWLESDAYRFAGISMLLAALVYYFRVALFTYTKPLIGAAGLACVAWALYVAARMGIDVALRPGKGFGTAEGIYLFPMLYPTFGYALFLYIRRPFAGAAAFMVISLAALLIGTDFHRSLLGERALTTLHNNTIHAANASGILMICAVAFGNYVLHRHDLRGTLRTGLILLAAAVFSVAGLYVLGLQAKAVWVALAVSLSLLFAMMGLKRHGARSQFIALAAVAVVIAGAAVFGQTLRSAGEKTADSSVSLVEQILSGESLSSAVSEAVADPNTALSVRDRLMIWSNGVEVWARHPVLGSGIAWLDDWDNRKYPEQKFTLLHNGYLEIAVRYGIVGLLFYAWLFLWALKTVRRASRAGLIEVTAYHAYLAVMAFFAVTLFTNSNNRLAFGETYMWFAVSFGFCCHYLLQERRLVRVRTYF
jgi:GR25 family glycosyltransferase involved in LPS biosynthesis